MDNHGEMMIYQTEDGLTIIDVNMQDETVWLSLEQMSDLFQRDKSTISRHIKNIFVEGELVRTSTVAKFATVQNEGSRQVEGAIGNSEPRRQPCCSPGNPCVLTDFNYKDTK